jgi:hypothetical protein
MTKLATAALIVIASVGAANAHPFDDPDGDGGCPVWGCGSNGTQLTGIQRQWAADAREPLVNRVVLPSGETIERR